MMKRLIVGVWAIASAALAWANGSSGVEITTGGDVPWFEQSVVTYQGLPAWQSGDLSTVVPKPGGESAETWIKLRFTGPCTLSFRVGFDTMHSSYLNGYLDGEYLPLEQSWSMSRMSWTRNAVVIADAGEHEIKLKQQYDPDWMSSVPSAAWVADIQRTPAPSSVTVNFDANGGQCATSSRAYATGRAYGSLPTPTRAVGTFEGWYTLPIGGVWVSEKDFVRFDVTTLYARWSIPIEEALGVDDDVTVTVDTDWKTGEPAWYGNVDHSRDGNGCACAGNQGSNGKKFSVSMDGPGTLSFWARCIGGELDVNLKVPVPGEYYTRTVSLADITPYGIQTHSVTGAVVRTRAADGWVHFDVELYDLSENEVSFTLYGYTSTPGAMPHALVDEMRWSPATSQAVVTFEYAVGSFLASRSYAPGDKYCTLPTPPARTGYVFGGWCTDKELGNPVFESDYVPLSGVHLYAKWAKTLALKNDGWYESERTYTTQEKVYQTDFTPGVHYTWVDYEVPGPGFFSFWMSVTNQRRWEIYVDGVLQVIKGSYGYTSSGGSGFSEWKRTNLLITGNGKHTVRFAAMAIGYHDGQKMVWTDAPGAVQIKNGRFENYEHQTTFGAWTDKTRNYSCWVTGNMPSLQSKYAGDKTPKGRVLYALTTLMQEGESTSLQSVVKSFGITINYMRMHGEGKADFRNAMSGNAIVDAMKPECETRIKTALASLEEIPDGFSPVAITTEDCAYFDEAISLDTGDVLYMRAALKGLLAFAHLSKAYNVAVDYNQLQNDCNSAKIARASSESALWKAEGWSNIDWLSPCNPNMEKRDAFKVVTVGNYLYVLVPSPVVYSFSVRVENRDTHKSKSLYYYASDSFFTSSFEQKADFGDARVYRCDLSKSSLSAASTGLKDVSAENLMDGTYRKWQYSIVECERFLLHQKTVADKIRNPAELTAAKSEVTAALQVWKRADNYVVNRKDNGLHLIEYGNHTPEATRCLQAMRRNLPKALTSLTDGSVQSYEWRDLLMRDTWYERYKDTFADPIQLDVNKVFAGKLTRDVLPPSISDQYFVPALYAFEPTLGGFMPGTTRAQWTKFLDAAKIEHSEETPCAFDYVVNPDGTITLTGVRGLAPTGAFDIPATYDSKVVAGVGEKFLEKTSGITTLTIEEGVRFIGREAFHEISTLERVSFPATLTNVNEKAFCDCPKLAEFVMPVENDYVKIVDGVLCDFGLKTAIAAENGVTALSLPKGILRIGKQAFAGHTKLKTADLGASDLETMGKNAFAGCTSLASVTFPTMFESADEEPFLFCAKLKAVYFLGPPPTVDKSFYWLEEDNPSRLAPATSYVKLGRGWDAYYAQGSWCGRPVAYVEPYVFEYDVNPDGTITLTGVIGQLTKGALTIGPTYDGLPVAGVGENFLKKTSAAITTVTIAEGVRYLGADAFHDIPTLTGVTLPSTLTNVGEKAFCDCPKLSKITMTVGNDHVKVVNGVLYDFGRKTAVVGANTLASLTLPDGITRLGAQAFCACARLQKADLSTSDLEAMAKNAFAGCLSLTSVYFPAVFVEAGEEPFLSCARLKEVYFFGPPPTVDESFYWLEEDNPSRLVPATTIVRENKGWTDVPGLWMGRPIVYGDPYILTDYCVGSSLFGTVSGGNKSVKAGTVVTLKATAAKNYVFAGWYYDEDGVTNVVGVNDYRSPSFQYKVEHDTNLYAKFIPKTDDTYILVVCDFDPEGYPAGEYVSVPVTVYSHSLPTVTVSGLPAGLKYDAKTMTISGVPTKSGDFKVTVTAKNVSGATVSKPCPVTVYFYDLALEPVIDGDTHGLPTTGLKLTGAGAYAAKKTVKLSATAPKGYVFTGWTADEEGLKPLDNGSQDFRTATGYSYVTTAEDVTLYAHFRAIQEDFCDNITIEDESPVPQGRISVDSKSLPTITVTGLPAGLTFDKKTNALVVDGSKLKLGDYAFVISAKNAAGYKVDRVVMFQYGVPETYERWEHDFALGEIVCEEIKPEEEWVSIVSLTIKTLPAGLKMIRSGDAYFIKGIPTKPGRYPVTFTFKVIDGSGGQAQVLKPWYMIVNGAPSRYVEIATDGSAGCTVTGSGVYAAGATVNTSAKAAKDCVFRAWQEGTNGYYNVYADYLGKDGDARLAAQTWLCGTYRDNDTGLSVPTLPRVPAKNYMRLTGHFVGAWLDDPGDIAILNDETFEDVGDVWNVKIEDGTRTSLPDECTGVDVSVDSVSAPKLTIKGTVAGLTVGNYGTYATLYCDPNGRTQPKPGEYTLTFSAVNQSKKTTTRTLTVRVPNIIDQDYVIWPDYGPDGAFFKSDYSAYTVGEEVDLYEEDVFGSVPEGMVRQLTVSSLPPGVTFKDGCFSGIPTKAGCYTVTVSVRYKYDGDPTWYKTSATVYFRVEAIDPSVVGTFNGVWRDADTNELGTVTATLASTGKLSNFKVVDLQGKTTSVSFTKQDFLAEEGFYAVYAEDKGGAQYAFEFYPAAVPAEEVAQVELAGEMDAYFGDAYAGEAYQNVWGDKTYKDAGLLPVFPTAGITVRYADLTLVFKAAGNVSATRGGKPTTNRFELRALTFDTKGVWTGWLGYLTVNVPDGGAGYCQTFEVAVSADSTHITVKPVE